MITSKTWFVARFFSSFLIAFNFGQVVTAKEKIILQSTTSTANSGLYEHILPVFEAQLNIAVRVVAVGTGQAIRNADNCDGDVLLVHAREAEERFVEEGKGVFRADVMYNDFVVVGPKHDPANLRALGTVREALRQVALTRSKFVSRSDDSGTHRKEMRLWASADYDPLPASGDWYLETGAGMGATLNTGVGLAAYVLTDRATWIAFNNKSDYEILVEGDPALFNQYGVIPISAEHCPSVSGNSALKFVAWILSETGQEAIESFELGGTQLFFPNASTNFEIDVPD
ncbi:MAG: substrate-binding domain-containing protein [Pseudomonadota bacterium]